MEQEKESAITKEQLTEEWEKCMKKVVTQLRHFLLTALDQAALIRWLSREAVTGSSIGVAE